MAEFNWDDHPIAQDNSKASSKDSGHSSEFSWDDHPVEVTNDGASLSSSTPLADKARQDGSPKPEVGTGRAALVGAGQGATFGFGDEITAPFMAAAGMSDAPSIKHDDGSQESTWEKYKRLMQLARDTSREEQDAAKDQHPLAYTGGAIAGGFAAPGAGLIAGAGKEVAAGLQAAKVPAFLARTAGVATAGATGGAIAGLGEGEGDLQDRLPNAYQGMKTGAGVGTVLGAGGEGLRGLGAIGSKAAEIPLVKKSLEAFRRGTNGENLVTESGRRAAADAARGTSGELLGDLKTSMKGVGTQIDNNVKSAAEQGKTVDLSESIPDVLKKLQVMKGEGSQASRDYATEVDSQIRKILKIGPDKGAEAFGTPVEDLPEGMIAPETKTTDLTKVSPKDANDLQKVLRPLGKTYNSLEIDAAKIASDARGSVIDPLGDATGNNAPSKLPSGEEGPSLNSKYGKYKDIFENTLKIDPNADEFHNTSAINNKMVTRLGKEGSTGDNARALEDELMDKVKDVNPDLADKYGNRLQDNAHRLQLAGEISRGLNTGFGFASAGGTVKAAANVAGMGAAKVPGLVNGVQKTATFAQAVMNSPRAANAVRADFLNGSGSTVTEPYKMQRQVATAAENAEPQLLTGQAQEIRKKYGNQGEQLATILENMSGKDKDARRALMFTVLQNQAYRKMLGLTDESGQ